jgi:lysophospholipase L1-like esterase
MAASVRFSVRLVRRTALLAGGATVGTLAAEVWAAMRHRFLPVGEPHKLDRVLGPEDAEPLVLAVLGDSSVAGVGADTPETTLTYGVAKVLAERYRVTLYCFGVSGARLANVVSEQLPRLAEIDPDVVLVCAGVNDITHCTPLLEVRRQLRLLATGLETVAPDAVKVVSGLPPAETSRAFRWPLRSILGTWARAYTRLYKAELEHHGITVLDITKVARAAFHKRREMFSDDWFHPSSTGYTWLGVLYGSAVRDALERARATQPQQAVPTARDGKEPGAALAGGLAG